MYTQKQQKAFFEATKEAIELKDRVFSRVFAEPEIEQLRELIIYHEWRYYVLNEPIVADWEYDRLFKRLQKLENTFPETITPNSPTQRVSPDSVSDLDTVAHLTPMLS